MNTKAAQHTKKRFGQHFLRNQSVIDQIICAISPHPQDIIIEIGPGRGALTVPLLQRVNRLETIELDYDLIPGLRALADPAHLIIHQGDVLQFDFSRYNNQATLRLVGNLPYNVSTPILFHLLSSITLFKDMHFMLQKEVVERLAARPGESNYSRLSVMIQSSCKVEYLFNVNAESFSPAPKVESAVIRLTPYSPAQFDIEDKDKFSTLVKQAFAQRRKTLRNNLKPILSASKITALGIDPGARPQTLSVDQFARLSRAL